ncbi:hypothetical protein QWM81_13035 [Streptomyces ficellus]|uniref:Uncharacterized protein n=1 Tax=Streptomyces ficellus TaxID=1977088 RepID=A0ABT7Z642_9ACTN|nr:hypothetical protein [Streptomyces ficellus]MDN3294960.1 hypothetical protein [Streptomyces ficellus]
MSAVRSALVLSLACAGLLLSAAPQPEVATTTRLQAQAPGETAPILTTNDLTWGP